MFEEEKVESNHLGPLLSPSTPSPPLLTSAQQQRHRYKQRESTPPQLASTAESKRRRQRWESAAKIALESFYRGRCIDGDVYMIVLLM